MTAWASVALACSSPTDFLSDDGRLPLGSWGGDNGGLIVSDTAAHLHIGCTFGDISGRIPLDATGNFDVSGSYLLRAYPIAVGPTMPARFTGRLSGSVVTVTATVDDTIAHATTVKGPVSLKLGAEIRLDPCPICRRPVVESFWGRVRRRAQAFVGLSRTSTRTRA